MTIEEAKALMAPTAIQHLKDMVAENIIIDTSKKSACDILMAAFCKAVVDEPCVIKKTSLNDYFIHMLNGTTNTMSQTKLGELMTLMSNHQPDLACIFTLYNGDMTNVIQEWVFKTPNPSFNGMYEFIMDYYQITPVMIRERLSTVLKQTIANNIAQFTMKYNSSKDKESLVISITTITRLVNMMGAIITCEFKEVF